MNDMTPYTIANIHTSPRHPHIIYAEIRTREGILAVSATLDYCVQWLKDAIEKDQHD